jgi:hypothetical protein
VGAISLIYFFGKQLKTVSEDIEKIYKRIVEMLLQTTLFCQTIIAELSYHTYIILYIVPLYNVASDGVLN